MVYWWLRSSHNDWPGPKRSTAPFADLEDEPPAAVSGLVPTMESLESEGPPEASLEQSRRAAATQAALVRILPGGIEGEEYAIPDRGVLTIGRTDCDVAFPNDTHLATPHASIVHSEDGYLLRDDGSRSGVFLRLPVGRDFEINAGDLVRVGRQFLMFEVADGRASLTHYDVKGQEVAHHELNEGKLVLLGRRAPDITLDRSDMTLSRRQLAVALNRGRLTARDLKSANGSYLRVRGGRLIEHGQQFRIGQQVLALCLEDQVLDLPEPPSASRPEIGAADAVAVEAPAPSADAPVVTFKPAGVSVPVMPGQTLCEAAEAAGVSINAECHSGICGSDPIRILSGAENLQPPDDQESDTLEEICELTPGECRLACMTRITGPVEVEILET